MNLIEAAFPALVAQSCKIGGLILFLGLLRWVMRGRIPQRILFAIWIVVALALLFPVSISVPWKPVSSGGRSFSGTTAAPAMADASASFTSNKISKFLAILDPAVGPAISSQVSSVRFWRNTSLLVVVWLLGVATLLAVRAGTWHRFRARLGQSVVPVNPKYLAVVRECREMLGVRTPISVFESDAAAGPAIGGLRRPYLVVPSSLSAQLSDEELRLVVLHEIGHWCRRDTAANALVQCALIVHWFNPAVWFFASMARLDCELACDEFVLGHAAASGPTLYGQTILKVLATIQRRNAPAALLGILGGKQQIKRRITMIARFKTAGLPQIAAGCCLVGLVALLALTSKLKASGADAPQPVQTAVAGPSNNAVLKHYESAEWKFAIDTPTNWNRFPPVSSNSPFEVTRFQSVENGVNDLLIVFREPRDPKESPTEWAAKIQGILAKGGFGNFVAGQTTIGSRTVLTLDFDRSIPGGGTWSCRHYMIADGTLRYVLGFGTNQRAQIPDLYDRMAKTFRILE